MVRQPQFHYLQSLPPPEAVEELTFETIRDEILVSMSVQLPAWTQHPDDPLYKAIENFAYREYLIRQRVNANIRQTLLAFASGANLDHLAALVSLSRAEGEEDDDLRERFATSLVGLSVGTAAAIRANCFAAGVQVDDVQITVATNGQDITVYPASGGAALSTDDQITLLDYIADPARVHIGDTLTIGTITTHTYTIDASVTYDSRTTDRVALEAAIRQAVYAFISEHQKVGSSVNLSILTDALVVDGVIDVSVSAPTSSHTGVVGQIPTCSRNTTDVTLTFTDAAP